MKNWYYGLTHAQRVLIYGICCVVFVLGILTASLPVLLLGLIPLLVIFFVHLGVKSPDKTKGN
jgi:hypothetical protein